MEYSSPGSSVQGFSRQEYWSGLPYPPPGDLPNQGLNMCFQHLLHWLVGSLPLVPPGKPIIKPYTASRMLLLSHFSRVRLLAMPWTAAYQAPPSMGFSWQEYWSRVPLPSPFLFISLLKFHLQISPSLLNPLSEISVPFFFFLPLSLFNF